MTQRYKNPRNKKALSPEEQEFRRAVQESLGKNIRKRRVNHMSQETMAGLVGLSRPYFGGVERGKHNIAVVNLCKLALALGCEPSKLLPTLKQLRELEE